MYSIQYTGTVYSILYYILHYLEDDNVKDDYVKEEEESRGRDQTIGWTEDDWIAFKTTAPPQDDWIAFHFLPLQLLPS